MATATSALTVQNWFSTTLSSAISASDTTIPLNAVPSGAEGFLIIEPDSATAREVIYFTSKTASDVVCPSAALGRGVDGTSAASHASGSTVKMEITSSFWKALQDGSGMGATVDLSDTLKVDHIAEHTAAHGVNIDGLSMKDGLVVGGAGTGVSNAGLDTTAGEPGGVWKTWTPTFTNFTKGSATIVAVYTQIGKTVHFILNVTLSSSTMGTAPQFTLPVTASANNIAYSQNYPVYISDAASTDYCGVCTLINTTTAQLYSLSVVGALLSRANFTSTAPMTWANNDIFSVCCTYEAA